MTYDAALAKARWAELERQDDLDWDLDAITDRSEAIDFLRRFENRLCIYSSYVEKLYSNYSFVIPESQEGGITILPEMAVMELSEERQKHIPHFRFPEPAREVCLVVNREQMKARLIDALREGIMAHLPEGILNQDLEVKVL